MRQKLTDSTTHSLLSSSSEQPLRQLSATATPHTKPTNSPLPNVQMWKEMTATPLPQQENGGSLTNTFHSWNTSTIHSLYYTITTTKIMYTVKMNGSFQLVWVAWIAQSTRFWEYTTSLMATAIGCLNVRSGSLLGMPSCNTPHIESILYCYVISAHFSITTYSRVQSFCWLEEYILVSQVIMIHVTISLKHTIKCYSTAGGVSTPSL